MSLVAIEYDELGNRIGEIEVPAEEEFCCPSLNPDMETGSKDLVDNTSEWGPFTVVSGEAVPRSRWPIAPAWIQEVEAPWRRGVGISIRTRRPRVMGIWLRRLPPREPTSSGEVDEMEFFHQNVLPMDLLSR